MSEYQSEINKLAREKVRAYISGNPLEWNTMSSRIQDISTTYNVPTAKIDDDLRTEYKDVYKRTVEYAARNHAALFSRTQSTPKG